MIEQQQQVTDVRVIWRGEKKTNDIVISKIVLIYVESIIALEWENN